LKGASFMKKTIISAVLLLCAFSFAAAEGITTRSVSIAYQTPAVAMVSGNISHTIPCMTGDGTNPLLAENNVTFTAYGEVTPLTVGVDFSAYVTPFPVIVFGSGVYTGTGWNFMGVEGIGAAEDHFPLYYKPWAKVTLQMDMGALIPGYWTHVITQYTYQVQYENLAGLSSGAGFTWLGGSKKAVPGWYSSGLVGYVLPLVPGIDFVAAQFEWEGTYEDGCNASHVNCLTSKTVRGTDSLAFQLRFDLTAGFESAALQYTHNF